MTRGDWQQLTSGWEHAHSMTALGSQLYVADTHTLYRVDDAGEYEAVGDDTWQPRFLVGVSGYLLDIEPGGALYRIDPRDTSYEQLDGTWQDVELACAGGDWLYVIDSRGTLYRVSPADGSYTELEGGWSGTTALTAAAGCLVAITDGGTMYRVNPKDGSYEELPDSWRDTGAAAGDDHRAYVRCATTLYQVDPSDGSYEHLTDTTWQSRLLAVAGSSLFTIEPGGTMYRISLT
jgi:hypothetical protein